MTKFQIFASSAPYPELAVYSVSRRDVLALTDDYAGRESETTAIMQYAYQSYILKEKYPDLSYVLENIAKVEMLHHELLAEAIVASGGDPIIAGRHCFWSGSTVDYSLFLVGQHGGLLSGRVRDTQNRSRRRARSDSQLQTHDNRAHQQIHNRPYRADNPRRRRTRQDTRKTHRRIRLLLKPLR